MLVDALFLGAIAVSFFGGYVYGLYEGIGKAKDLHNRSEKNVEEAKELLQEIKETFNGR